MTTSNTLGLRLAIALGFASLLVAPVTASGQSFVVIVNAQSPVNSLPTKVVSDLFLKRSQDLGATAAKPVDLDVANPARQEFSKAILGRPAAAVVSYWRQQVFAGREVPPPEKSAPADVIAAVAVAPGGIGYVPANTSLPPTVKKIDVTP